MADRGDIDGGPGPFFPLLLLLVFSSLLSIRLEAESCCVACSVLLSAEIMSHLSQLAQCPFYQVFYDLESQRPRLPTRDYTA